MSLPSIEVTVELGQTTGLPMRKSKTSSKGKEYPAPQKGLSNSVRAALALKLAKDPSGLALFQLTADVVQRAKAVEELEARLRGDAVTFDFEGDSLQNRLLEYFESELGFARAKDHLLEAEASRRVLLAEVERAGLLGLHAANKEIAEMVSDFSNYDLHLLHTAVIAEDPSVAMAESAVVEVITRKILERKGEATINYLASRMKLHVQRMQQFRERMQHHGTRMKLPETTALEVLNPTLVVLGTMWTDPSCPLWLMPAAAAITVTREGCGNAITTSAYNQLVKEHRLKRLPQPVLDNFLATERTDARCIRLRLEFEKVTGISLAQVRRGRRPSS